MINRSLRIKALLVLVCLSFNSVLFAQDKSAKKSIEAQKEFLVNYLKTFDTYISNPDSFAHNKATVLNNFESQKSKTVYNFINPVEPPEPKKKNSKPKYKVLKGEFISAEKLVSDIEQSAPDGLGMSFNKDKIELVGKTNSFTHKTFVLKAPVEYSGFRKDGSLVSYANDQYFYINSTSRKNKVGHIKEKKHFDHTFRKEQRRKGLFLELSSNLFSIAGMTGIGYNFEQHEDVAAWGFSNVNTGYITHYSSEGYNAFNSKNLSLIYMFTPGIGIGAGIAKHNSSTVIALDAFNFHLPDDGTTSYITSIYTNNDGYNIDYVDANGWNNMWQSSYPLEHKIDLNATVIPFFLRLHGGRRMVTLSADIGFKAILNPTYQNYLTGRIRRNEIDKITKVTTSYPAESFDNTMIDKQTNQETLVYLFYRLNFNIQPTKHFYIRLSAGAQGGRDVNYKQSRHQWDMHALGLPISSNDKTSYELFMEFAVGVNINNLIP